MYCQKRSWKLQNSQVKKVTRRCGVQWGHDRGQSEVTTRGVEGGPVMVSVRNSCIPGPTVTEIFTITQHRPQIKFSNKLTWGLVLTWGNLVTTGPYILCSPNCLNERVYEGWSMGEWKTHCWVFRVSIAFYCVQVPKQFFHTPH